MAREKQETDCLARRIEEDCSLAACEFAGIDFESAGTEQGSTEEAIQVGLGVFDGGDPEKVDCLFRSYLAPTKEVVWRAGEVHGIGPNDLINAPPLRDIWPELNLRLGGRVVVAHGVGTEKKFLRAFPMHGFAPWLDTLVLARRTLPGLSDYSLASCCAALGVIDEASALCAEVEEGMEWHDALFDTVACLLLLRSVISSLGLWDLPLSGLREMGVVSG